MIEAGLPPVVEHNARASGTDAAGYFTEAPGFTTSRARDSALPRYSTTARGSSS